MGGGGVAHGTQMPVDSSMLGIMSLGVQRPLVALPPLDLSLISITNWTAGLTNMRWEGREKLAFYF